jgi:GNAT superfamily N-acetyltransferase
VKATHRDAEARAELVEIRDGSTIQIRPIRASDKGAIATAFDRLSEESRYRRFFAPLQRLSDRDLAYLTEVDHRDHEALIAATEQGEPLGVARFVRLADDPGRAEVAVAVIDDWHGRGVATALLTRLSDRARAEGIRTFTAATLGENRAAQDLMRSFGSTRATNEEPGLLTLQLELPRRGIGRALRDALRRAAAGAIHGRDPAHPQTRLRRSRD